jgi:hypothetical protein
MRCCRGVRGGTYGAGRLPLTILAHFDLVLLRICWPESRCNPSMMVSFDWRARHVGLTAITVTREERARPYRRSIKSLLSTFSLSFGVMLCLECDRMVNSTFEDAHPRSEIIRQWCCRGLPALFCSGFSAGRRYVVSIKLLLAGPFHHIRVLADTSVLLVAQACMRARHAPPRFYRLRQQGDPCPFAAICARIRDHDAGSDCSCEGAYVLRIGVL